MDAAAEPTLDDVRAFWDRRPCNVKHSPKLVGTKEYFDEVDQRRYFVEPHILHFMEAEKWRGKKVLEVGCGIGTDTSVLAKAGAKVTGTELSQASLDIAKQRFAVSGLTVQFYLANGEEMSRVVPVEPYDLVYSFGVIHHSPHPEKIITEIEKYMTPQSELRIMLYAKYSWKSLMIFLGFDQPEAQYGCPIANTYSKREARELLKDFEIISIKKDHIFPYRISEYKEYRYVKKFPWNIMPSTLFSLIKRWWGWHLLITARLKPDVSQAG
ncbi:MAG: methyltransferase domain-containing protein [Patescibacteria group bacterium]|nr:methyltransferase domain-containing protein [Patescibacteria group bacterium]